MRKKKTIAKIALTILEAEAIETGNARPTIGYGFLTKMDEVARLAEMGGHPLDNHAKILSALDRAKDMFTKRKMRAHDANGRSRLVRVFEPKWDLHHSHVSLER